MKERDFFSLWLSFTESSFFFLNGDSVFIDPSCWVCSSFNSLWIMFLKLELSFIDSSWCWISELFFSLTFWKGTYCALDDWKGSVTLEYWHDLSFSSTCWALYSTFFIDFSSYLSLWEDLLLLLSDTSDFLLFSSSFSSWDLSFLMLRVLEDLLAFSSRDDSTFSLFLLFESSIAEGC